MGRAGVLFTLPCFESHCHKTCVIFDEPNTKQLLRENIRGLGATTADKVLTAFTGALRQLRARLFRCMASQANPLSSSSIFSP